MVKESGGLGSGCWQCWGAEFEGSWSVVVNGELLERLHSALEAPGMGGSCSVTAMGLHTSQKR